MGCNQGEQPALREEGMGPALMIGAAGTTPLAPTFAQDAAQARSQPLIDRLHVREHP